MLTKDQIRADGATPVPASVALGRDRRPHAVVIGAGFGGLAAAIRLSVRGYRVTVLDRLDGPGGRGTAFRQDGYVMDAGPTIVTVPQLFEDLWAICGKRMSDHVDLKPMDPFYRIRFDDGESFVARPDPQAMEAEIARLSPSDLPGWQRLLKRAETRYEVGFEGMGKIPFHNFSTMASWLPRMGLMRADRSVHAEVSRNIKDERLRQALSFHPLFIGGNPFAVTSMYCLVSFLEAKWGVHYAMGGTNALAQGLADLVLGEGGEIRYGETVDEILTDGARVKGVRLETGEEIEAPVVISNADAGWTYSHLLRARRRKRWTDAKIRRTKLSMGLFVWYFGTDRRWDEVDHHTILMGPRYRPLVDDIFRKGVLADDMSLYLHRPSASDPSVAPEGCDSFYALAPVPHLGFDIDWETEGARYRERVAERLEETVLPGLRSHIATEHVMTPVDFRDRYLSPQGAGFSFEPRLLQSAWFRPHNRSEEVEGLYLVGAGTHPGAGLPGVVVSALLLDELVPDAQALA